MRRLRKRGIGFFYEHGLFVVPQASLRLKIYIFLSRRNVQRACSAFVFDEFISHGKLFYRVHKRVISSMQCFTKKISKRKGKYSGEIVLYPVNIDEHCS